MRPYLFPAASLCAILCSVPACSGPAGGPLDGGPPDASRAIGVACVRDLDCASGACLSSDHVCTATCATDLDCPSATGGRRLVCGVASCASPGGCSMCVPPCGAAGYTCVAGVSTECSVAADPTLCIDCGCPDATTHCVRDVGCLPPAAVGDACHLDRDCASGSCSTFGGVCRVPVGSPCTSANCDACLRLPSGVTHCSRECRTDAECNGDDCAGSAALIHYECSPPQCASTPCAVDRAPHETGQTCHADTDCRSGACFAAARCSGSECIGEGWCAEPCGAGSSCPPGNHCVSIPCVTGQTVACGDVCLHACAEFVDCGVYGGTCSALETPSRTLESVCDVRRPGGASCLDARECLSASCVSGRCAP